MKHPTVFSEEFISTNVQENENASENGAEISHIPFSLTQRKSQQRNSNLVSAQIIKLFNYQKNYYEKEIFLPAAISQHSLVHYFLSKNN